MNDIALLQQEIAEISPVLTRHADDQCNPVTQAPISIPSTAALPRICRTIKDWRDLTS